MPDGHDEWEFVSNSDYLWAMAKKPGPISREELGISPKKNNKKVKRTVSKWRLETDEEEPNPLFKNIICCNCGRAVGANNLSTDYIYCPYCGSKNQER